FYLLKLSTDLKNIDMLLYFLLGTPFCPYEHLMGVLPLESRDQIPSTYHDLMYVPNSPIFDFNPLDFELDLS
ncbi:hypothetical protein PILCRDRAFT_53010, partial [Piloderma croceum F 1598]